MSGRSTIRIVTFLVLCSFPLHAQDATWSKRDLSSLERDVLAWMPEEEREKVLAEETIEKARARIAKAQDDSPFKKPWKRSDLADDQNATILLEFFDKFDREEQKRLCEEETLARGKTTILNAWREETGNTAGASFKVEIDDPEVRNPGTSRARIRIKGKAPNVKDEWKVRVTGEVRYPQPDGERVAEGRDVVKRGGFDFEMRMPSKTLPNGVYWVRISLDFASIRDKKVRTSLMVDGELPVVSATRICYVGIDKEFINNPKEAPAMVAQDVDIKLMYQSFISTDPIEIGGEGYPASDPMLPYWEDYNRRIAELDVRLREKGAMPAAEVMRVIRTRSQEMGEFFDVNGWRETLDSQIYPALDALEEAGKDYERDMAVLVYPDYNERLLDRGSGIVQMLREYAALTSRELYAANEQVAPPEDERFLRRSRARTTKDCISNLQYSLAWFKHERKGVGPATVCKLLQKLSAFEDR